MCRKSFSLRRKSSWGKKKHRGRRSAQNASFGVKAKVVFFPKALSFSNAFF
jgi:hypothetical protein